MANHPMQVCMETDWLKAIIPEDSAMDNSSSPSGELISCSKAAPPPPLLERRLRPPHDQALKCPRCDSTHTKFCYYNNYSLSQPRYFCKTCRRYWTKGGSLRNVPVGGGCRKNKRSTAKKSSDHHHPQIIHHHQPTDLHLSNLSNLNFMFETPNHLFAGGCDIGLGDHSSHGYAAAHGFLIDNGLALPFDGQEGGNVVDVKPGNRMLSLEWPEQGCGDSFGYSNGLGLWGGMINGHGPSSAAM